MTNYHRPSNSIPSTTSDVGRADAKEAAGRVTAMSSSQHVPSPPIPIHSPFKRTNSELELYREEAIADYKDYCMCTRIVEGIRKRQASKEDNGIINSILWTRIQPLDPNVQEHEEIGTTATCDHDTLSDEGIFILDL